MRQYIMKPFRIKWEIDVDGENAVDAAQTALKIVQDKDSLANIFTVEQIDTGEEKEIDLSQIDG